MSTTINHPYIGLHGRVRVHPYSGPDEGKNDYAGTVAAVGQGGSTVEERGAAFIALIILRDEAHPLTGRWHEECDAFNFIPDDPAEARRRLRSRFPLADFARVQGEAAGKALATELRAWAFANLTTPATIAEGIGHGLARAIYEGHDGRGTLPGLAEAVGRGWRGGGA